MKTITPNNNQQTAISEIDELRELIERLYIRQRKTEQKLVETSEELKRVSRELLTVNKQEGTESTTTIVTTTTIVSNKKFNKGDKVLVTTKTKDRYGDLAIVYRQPHPRARFIWVLPEGKLPGDEYKVTRKFLEIRK